MAKATIKTKINDLIRTAVGDGSITKGEVAEILDNIVDEIPDEPGGEGGGMDIENDNDFITTTP